MKKHTKRVLGLFGLGAVVATTAFAVSLPNNPEALATTGVTDTIQVRVVGSEVDATITKPSNDAVFVNPNQEIAFDYANANKVVATLNYTNINGQTSEVYRVEFDRDYGAGSYAETLNLDNYGYGIYKLNVESTGLAISDEDSVSFRYLPVTGSATQIGTTGAVKVDLDYNNSDSSPIKKIKLDVYLHGLYVKTVFVDSPDLTKTIDFSRMLSGTYTIMATALNQYGAPLYLSYPMTVVYQSPFQPIPVPNTADTGGMFKNSNISQTDYLITGIIVFGIVAIAGIAFMMRNEKRTTRNRKSNRRK